ncbi:Serine-threonine/tyrosine-protein kinase, catalytic domain [Sesbania bispinosa]|nr:Serine-threonine/tyrosine-protein kinase, catalytic domain [Sesbania bispinosa]
MSTEPNCGDPHSQKLYFDTLNRSSYLVLRIMSSIQRLVVQPSPWLPGSCVTQDMPVNNGIWLNQSLPLVSPLNCTSSSICHHYLESSGHVDTKRALECASDLHPCCTFVAGGKPANQWEEGLEIQWTPPPEPVKGIALETQSVPLLITKSCKLSSNREKKQAKEREVVLKSRSGGFGEVYRGELQDGTLVAVKKARVGNLKSTQQVLNEVAILSQVNHKNLVRLLGCCVESEQPLMIYEYISNGTLYDHVHGRSDFGLSRLANPGLSHLSTCAEGTLGYLDPEYYRNYQITDKSDVYSYGVVLLELLTSQKAIDFTRDQDDVNLAIHVSQYPKKEKPSSEMQGYEGGHHLEI